MKSVIKSYHLIIILLFISCASTNFSHLPLLHALPESEITVKDNKILHGGQIFAELKYYFSANLSENKGEAYMFSAETQHRGLAIYYHNTDKLIWIFPEDGREEDVSKRLINPTGEVKHQIHYGPDITA